MVGKCELCERAPIELTKHHLIPREEGGKNSKIADLCETCHKQIHNTYTNVELALFLNSITRLRDDDKLKSYLKFIKKQPSTKKIKVKKTKKNR